MTDATETLVQRVARAIERANVKWTHKRIVDDRDDDPGPLNIALATAALAVVESERGWREIATAPKDGTWLLLFDDDIGAYVGRQFPSRHPDEPKPTHWLPLPPPPPLTGAKP